MVSFCVGQVTALRVQNAARFTLAGVFRVGGHVRGGLSQVPPDLAIRKQLFWRSVRTVSRRFEALPVKGRDLTALAEPRRSVPSPCDLLVLLQIEAHALVHLRFLACTVVKGIFVGHGWKTAHPESHPNAGLRVSKVWRPRGSPGTSSIKESHLLPPC